jgi:hypothetical protein
LARVLISDTIAALAVGGRGWGWRVGAVVALVGAIATYTWVISESRMLDRERTHGQHQEKKEALNHRADK